MADSEWIGLTAAGVLLGISSDSVRRMADAGVLASMRTPMGRWRRVSRAGVMQLRRQLREAGEVVAASG
jgi:excisionase family DNA binding protein